MVIPRTYKNGSNAYQAEYRNSHPVKRLFWNAKKRAKEKNLEFSITEEDIFIPLLCPIYKTPLNTSTTRGYDPTSATLDRRDNSKGYIPGNIGVISRRANTVKGDITISEIEKLIAYLSS